VDQFRLFKVSFQNNIAQSTPGLYELLDPNGTLAAIQIKFDGFVYASIQQENTMKASTRLAAKVRIGLALTLMMPIYTAFADSFEQLSAEWWQWAGSIPTSVNPQVDTSGQNAFVGQHGPVWFLAGFFGGGTAARTCSVPEGAALYFPIINAVNINAPNVCGQSSEDLPVKDLRVLSAQFIDGATNLLVTLDGLAIKNLRRVKSKIFAIALPEDNVFDLPCADGGVPAGIYSPAVDDGFYVLLERLPEGSHTLHFHAESGSFTQDITYNLTVVAVSTK
jgi:hypothetical protein